MGIRPSDRHDGPVWDLAGPAVLALAADPLLGVVDTAFVGRLGPEALVSQLADIVRPQCTSTLLTSHSAGALDSCKDCCRTH